MKTGVQIQQPIADPKAHWNSNSADKHLQHRAVNHRVGSSSSRPLAYINRDEDDQ
jgi:hypothetical protein